MTVTKQPPCPHVLVRSDHVEYECELREGHVEPHHNPLVRVKWATGVAFDLAVSWYSTDPFGTVVRWRDEVRPRK